MPSKFIGKLKIVLLAKVLMNFFVVVLAHYVQYCLVLLNFQIPIQYFEYTILYFFLDYIFCKTTPFYDITGIKFTTYNCYCNNLKNVFV